MKTTALLVVALSVPAFAANRSESRAISAFHAIDVSGGVRLIVKPSDTPALTLSGDEKLLAHLRTEVRNGTLVIEPTEHNLRDWTRVTVTVSTKQLDALEASGGVEVSLEGGVGSSLALDLSGGVELTAKTLALDSLALEASGGVSLHLAGTAKRASYEASGGVELDAAQLSVAQVKVDASGGCNLDVHATEAIEGEASGGVNVRVSGDPSKSRVKTSGAADVEYVKG